MVSRFQIGFSPDIGAGEFDDTDFVAKGGRPRVATFVVDVIIVDGVKEYPYRVFQCLKAGDAFGCLGIQLTGPNRVISVGNPARLRVDDTACAQIVLFPILGKLEMVSTIATGACPFRLNLMIALGPCR